MKFFITRENIYFYKIEVIDIKNIGKVAFVIIGSIIGAGFASRSRDCIVL